MADFMASSIPVALTIAGSDSGGGAGIQADLRTFAFHCVHGTSALTCITAQNTLGVNRLDALLPEVVKAQIEAVVQDIGVQATKTGMLLNQDIILVVAEVLETLSLKQLVVDPVMVSRAGVQLIDNSAVAALRDFLLPKASIVTPNIYEAQMLAGLDINNINDMRLAAEKIHKFGVNTVLVKGGALKHNLRGVDVWFDGESFETLKTSTVDTNNTHGTGCTLSAAIAANLAQGQDLFSAVTLAKNYVTSSLQYALEIGQGQGPVGHFFPLLLNNYIKSS
ncbi:MAG: bifunctional hydroxymethylpyrimidine kinase/phosphomethylpyrimidine kinase [Trichodesmium sp. St2_bin6]|nr:bifunctional hydroxymethylpyrimidine kinase/phosphomethylpyrimidine kinase [Trichodesmium sp. St2_bin6]